MDYKEDLLRTVGRMKRGARQIQVFAEKSLHEDASLGKEVQELASAGRRLLNQAQAYYRGAIDDEGLSRAQMEVVQAATTLGDRTGGAGQILACCSWMGREHKALIARKNG